MIIAIWIIAICELIRIVQNGIQVLSMRKEKGMRENAYSEFVKSLKQTDKEFVKRMLEEFERKDA